MRRREFIALLGGTAAGWPLAARAQQPEGVRRIGVISGLLLEDPETQKRKAALHAALEKLGWTVGRNLQIEYRFGGPEHEILRKEIAELAALSPVVILSMGGTATELLLRATKTIPIVFVFVPDPVGSGFVNSLSRPGGNATGFMQYEYSLTGKWLELLKEIAPSVTRAGVLRDPDQPSGIGQFAVIQSVAPTVGVDVTPINLRSESDIEPAIADLAHAGNGGLIVTTSALSTVHRDSTIELAAKYKVPAVYSSRYYAVSGGLISYGTDVIDQISHSADYIDRILKGEKPANLPVEAPTKYVLTVNLKTAKVLGLTVPPTVLARADEVIE